MSLNLNFTLGTNKTTSSLATLLVSAVAASFRQKGILIPEGRFVVVKQEEEVVTFISDDKFLLEAIESGDESRFTKEDVNIINDLKKLGKPLRQQTSIEFLREVVPEIKEKETVNLDVPDIEQGALNKPDNKDVPDGFRRIGLDETLTMVSSATDTFQHFIDNVELDETMLKYIREMRVERRYTWRAVAETMSELTKGDWGSNQLAGMAFCDKAARHFNEYYQQEPWN